MASQNFPTSQSNTFNPQVNWVPRFKGNKYEQWNVQMKSLFIAQDIWDIIQDGYVIPKDSNEEASWDDTKTDLYKQNLRKDHYALSIIHRGVDETLFHTVMAAKTAKEAWNILETKYKGLKKMENNVQKVEIKRRQSQKEISVQIEESSALCIYKIPEYFQKGRKLYYVPKLLSIGPVFYNYAKLESIDTMKDLKQKYLECFRLHPDSASQSLEPYKDFVRRRESEIRQCYQHQLSLLPSDDFVDMIVLDAAFIIYYFLLRHRSTESHPLRPSCSTPLKFLVALKNSLGVAGDSLGRDLFLEENQLPFFVLTHIYDLAFGHLNPRIHFTHLALHYIGQLNTPFPGRQAIYCIIDNAKLTDASGITHLVHLRREACCCLNPSRRSAAAGYFHKFRSAKHLSDAGVRFKSSESDDQLDITFDKTTGVLKIPKITLCDQAEEFFRSVLFFEESHNGINKDNRYFIDYFCFLEKLIDTAEDIQILQHNEILSNQLGSDEDAVILFNKLTKNIKIYQHFFTYSEVSAGLKEYSASLWNKVISVVWSRRREKCWKYFNNHPWAILSVTYALILLILTILQTITGFLQI